MTNQNTTRCYEKNNISDVIFRVDFPKILSMDFKTCTAEFQKILIETFPIVKEVNVGMVKVKLDEENTQTEHEKEPAWEFLNIENNKKIFISSTNIFIQYLNNSYTNFEEFSKDIKLVLSSIIDLYPVNIVERIGLRYINQINIENDEDVLDWSGLIKPILYKLTQDFTSDENKILESMHLLEFEENGYNLKFQFGFFNSDYPSEVRRKEFVLDYDCSTITNMSISEVFNTVNEFHSIIKKWFEKSIDEDLREKMGITNGK